MTKNPVVFWELACHDAEKSVHFFSQIFDWKIDQPEGSPIHYCYSANDDGGAAGGVFTLRKAKLPFLTIYIQVDDIEEKAKLIAEKGGLVTIEPHEISPGTWICLFNDPSGVTFAMLEQRPKE